MKQYYKHKLAFICAEPYQKGMEDGFSEWSTHSCNEIVHKWLEQSKEHSEILKGESIKIPYKIIGTYKEYIFPDSMFIYTEDNKLLVYSPDRFNKEFNIAAQLDVNVINQLEESYNINKPMEK